MSYGFDDNVRYEIHVATGRDLARGRATFSYRFQFKTRFKNRGTILQAALGVIQDVGDANQNLTQTYKVTKVDRHGDRKTVLGSGTVPPNNQGISTPKYNKDNDGDNPAREGVASAAALDTYTRESIFPLKDGSRVFAGQRDDGFYADIHGVFDLLNLSGSDEQAGFNVHTMVLQIPVSEIGGDQQIVGVYAATSRQRVTVLREKEEKEEKEEREDEHDHGGEFVQVGRQGNPLFNEGFVAIRDKDRYSRTKPTEDREVFRKYAETPELAALLNAFLHTNAITTGRTDVAGIFIPDLIKVDLSTGPAHLAGDPDDAGFHRLGIFGGDVLMSNIQPGFGGGTIPGGWPNGRRFGDDVLDIGVCALLSDLRPNPPVIACNATTSIDHVDHNDMTYNKVMPYAATPQNGRRHEHRHRP